MVIWRLRKGYFNILSLMRDTNLKMSVFTWTSKGCGPPSAKETLQMRQYLKERKMNISICFFCYLLLMQGSSCMIKCLVFFSNHTHRSCLGSACILGGSAKGSPGFSAYFRSCKWGSFHPRMHKQLFPEAHTSVCNSCLWNSSIHCVY